MHHGGNNRGSGKWSESRFNLKVKPRCADVMDVASEEKIASEKTPHFTNLWNREVLFRGLTERGLTVVFSEVGGYPPRICKIALARFFLLVMFISKLLFLETSAVSTMISRLLRIFLPKGLSFNPL